MASHDRRHTVAALLIAALMVSLGAAPWPGSAATASQTLQLAVIVNDYPTGKIGEFVLQDGALFARREELRDLGFRVPESAAVTKQNLVALSSLRHLTSRLDQATQTLYVTAGTEGLLPALLETGAFRQGGYAIESGIGTTLDYDVTGTFVADRQLHGGLSIGRQIGSGIFDLRGFSPFASREVRPQDRSGVIVRFPLKTSHGALLRLSDEIGNPIAVGSTATLHSTGVASPVGYGGEAYLVDLESENRVDVEKPDGRRCTVSVDYRHTPGEIPTMGPLPCREMKP